MESVRNFYDGHAHDYIIIIYFSLQLVHSALVPTFIGQEPMTEVLKEDIIGLMEIQWHLSIGQQVSQFIIGFFIDHRLKDERVSLFSFL